jgi:hypothetical protein
MSCITCLAPTRCSVAAGEGILDLVGVLRRRLACSRVVNATLSTMRNTPRPLGFPGTQEVELVDITHRGRLYPDSVHARDVVFFVSPGDVEDAAYYAGESSQDCTARMAVPPARACWVSVITGGEVWISLRKGADRLRTPRAFDSRP